MKKFMLLGLLLTPLLAGSNAYAGDHGYGHHGYHGGHGHFRGSFGIYLGAPYAWDPFPYSYPYHYPYAYWPPVIVERAPQVYVEQPPVYVQQQPQAQTEANNFWYYCADSRAYYPYVQTCPTEWMRVVPQSSPEGPQ